MISNCHFLIESSHIIHQDCLFVYLSSKLSIFLSVYITVSIYLHIYLSIIYHLSIYLLIYIHIYKSIYKSIYLSIYLCICPPSASIICIILFRFMFLAYFDQWLFVNPLSIFCTFVLPSQNSMCAPQSPNYFNRLFTYLE